MAASVRTHTVEIRARAIEFVVPYVLKSDPGVKPWIKFGTTLRVSLVVIPYLAVLADIGSWWFTKFIPVFGFIVVVGGAIWGLALAGQILISLWEMWLPIRWSSATAKTARR